ncbi:Zinc finger MYM-type protein [Trichinella pseudospiralis]
MVHYMPRDTSQHHPILSLHGIKWGHVIGVCTDCAPAMLDGGSGLQTVIKQKSPNVIGTYYTVHPSPSHNGENHA